MPAKAGIGCKTTASSSASSFLRCPTASAGGREVKWFLGVLAAAFVIALAFYCAAAASAGGPHETGPAVRFVDITDSTGIRFKHTSAPEKKYIVESMSGGVALFDYDNDGCLDIYLTN